MRIMVGELGEGLELTQDPGEHVGEMEDEEGSNEGTLAVFLRNKCAKWQRLARGRGSASRARDAGVHADLYDPDDGKMGHAQ